MTVNANVTVGNPDLTHLPTAEEYALFREAYAEIYPVRPLMNAIDAKDAEIARLEKRYEREREAHAANLIEQRRVEAENRWLREELKIADARSEKIGGMAARRTTEAWKEERKRLHAQRDDYQAAYNRVATAARAVTAELQKVGDETEWRDGDETDRVFAWHELLPLVKALNADIHQSAAVQRWPGEPPHCPSCSCGIPVVEREFGTYFCAHCGREVPSEHKAQCPGGT